MSQAPQVTLDQLQGAAGATANSAKLLSPLQTAGLQLATYLLAGMLIASIGIAIVAFIGTPVPTPPVPPSTLSADTVSQYRDLVAAYKTLGDAPLDRAKDLFQLVVITALLPPFTAVLGYIFGTRKEGGD